MSIDNNTVKCRICDHPIVVVPIHIVTLDKRKDVYYEVVMDICDNCNGPIIGVRRYDRQDPLTFLNSENPKKTDKVEYYTKSNKDAEESKT